MKTCPKCKTDKPVSDYNKNKRRGDGFSCWCKSCTKVVVGLWRSKNKDRTRKSNKQWKENNRDAVLSHGLKQHHGITIHEYRKILESQGGVCAICRSMTPGGMGRFHVDHDHTTGVIRGILCFRCNVVLGFCVDNKEILIEAANYLVNTYNQPSQPDLRKEGLGGKLGTLDEPDPV